MFDLCLMKRELLNGSIEFGTQEKDGFIVDNVLHSDTQGDIHFSSYIPESYDGSEPYALFVTLPGWRGCTFRAWVRTSVKAILLKQEIILYNKT